MFNERPERCIYKDFPVSKQPSDNFFIITSPLDIMPKPSPNIISSFIFESEFVFFSCDIFDISSDKSFVMSIHEIEIFRDFSKFLVSVLKDSFGSMPRFNP